MTEPELTPELILHAYRAGIYPMGREDGTVAWYEADPRCIFEVEQFHVPKRLSRTYRQGIFEMRVDSNWHQVLHKCADRESTWLTPELFVVYTQLHELGFAHSVEAYRSGKLAGGLYGVSIGGAFMAESMYHDVTDASKVCLVYLAEHLKTKGYRLIDTQHQYRNCHLNQFGAKHVSREEYLVRLKSAITLNCSFL